MTCKMHAWGLTTHQNGCTIPMVRLANYLDNYGKVLRRSSLVLAYLFCRALIKLWLPSCCCTTYARPDGVLSNTDNNALHPADNTHISLLSLNRDGDMGGRHASGDDSNLHRQLRNDMLTCTAAYTACNHAHQLKGLLSYCVHRQKKDTAAALFEGTSMINK